MAPSSLTARLVATLVLVCVATTAVLALITSFAVHRQLYGDLDRDVQQAFARNLGRVEHQGSIIPPAHVGGMDGGDDGREPLGLGDPAGTLYAGSADGDRGGQVLTSSNDRRTLSTAALDVLDQVPTDGRVHAVDLPGVGSFHVRAYAPRSGDYRMVIGMSARKTEGTLANVVLVEIVVALTAVAGAAAIGRWVIRRQLRPLRDVAATAHEVAHLPLASGEIGTTVRVPAGLADQRSEVGSVGAALNTLLEHVEHALDERHRSEQQVRQFVADASHELRTPLTTIHGYAELSRRTRPADPAQLQVAMGKVEAEATRMSSLVEDLLLLARLDAGRPLARDEVDLTRLALETVGDARVVAPGHRWLLDLPDEPVTVVGDEQRLHQVVTNLLGNARRHTPPGTSVSVGVHPFDGSVVLSVADDGPGMPPELVATAFERFTRGDSSRTRESGGAGLGLSLVEAITAAHGGTVSVASEPGRTCFEVRLPASVPALEPLHR